MAGSIIETERVCLTSCRTGEMSMTIYELIQLLKDAECCEDIDARREEIASLMPTVRIMFDFDQKNAAHQYDLWHHCLHTVLGLGKQEDDMLYLAALIHDIGKPDCQRPGKNPDDPNMHYRGHWTRGMEIVRDRILPEIRESGNALTEDEERRLLYYVEYHDDHVSLEIGHLRRHLQMPVSLEEFRNLMDLEIADAKAHVQIPIIKERIRICSLLSGEYSDRLYEKILSGEA